MLLDELRIQGYRTSETIVERGTPIDKVYLVGDSFKSAAVFQGAIGWVELLRDEAVYRECAFNPNKFIKIPYLPLNAIRHHLLRFVGQETSD